MSTMITLPSLLIRSLQSTRWSKDEKQVLLDVLSTLLSKRSFSLDIIRLFRPVLMDLVARYDMLTNFDCIELIS